MNLHLVMALAVLFEVAICLRARWHLGCRRYDTIGFAVVATHCRVVAVVFIYLGGLVLLGLRVGRYVVVKLGLVDKVAELAAGRYWRVHSRLVNGLIIVEAKWRTRSLRKKTLTNPLNCHSPLALLHTNPDSPMAHLAVAQSNTRWPVNSWHGRVISIIGGLAAGLIVAGFVWLTGLYRFPGAAVLGVSHMGLFPFTICALIGGLIMGTVIHHGADDGSMDDGFAKSRHIRKSISARAVRRSTVVTRPGLGAKTLPVTESGTLLGWHKGRKRWAKINDVVLIVAPPQTGKTAHLGGRIIEAPGAVVATSTKADTYVHTAGVRVSHGPLWVLNPEGLGSIMSNFRWSPLEGCSDPDVAAQRAGYLLAGASKVDGENAFWRDMNVKLMRCLLTAAAIDDRSMADVWTWINRSTDPTPLRILQGAGGLYNQTAAELDQLMNDTPERTRQSVYITLAQAMAFMTLPAVASAICPAPGEQTFSLEQFVTESATLYLLGSDRPHASLAPLFSAITGYIFDGAKALAGQAYGGRLEPPLTLALDEAALICPVPLPSWTADSGGRNIQLLIAVQSPSQLYDRWGQRGGETILNTANARLVFGGLGHAKDLEDISKLCGERDERVQATTSSSGGHHSASMSVRRVPVLAPHEVRQLKDGHALLIYRNIPPLIVKTEKVWERKDVRATAAAVRRQLQAARRVPSITRAPGPTFAEQPASADNIIMLSDRRPELDPADQDGAAASENEEAKAAEDED